MTSKQELVRINTNWADLTGEILANWEWSNNLWFVMYLLGVIGGITLGLFIGAKLV